MKIQLLVAAALLLSVSAFAQKPEKSKNEQGTTVSTVARTQAEAGTKGQTVSGTANLKSQASVHRQNESSAERQQAKTDRKAERDARKQENKDFVAGVKAENETRVEGKSAEAKAAAEARKEMILEKKEAAKEAREEAKADRNNSEDALITVNGKSKTKIEKADRKAEKENRPVKVKSGVKAGTDVKIRRPRIGAKVQGSAGLGLGIN